MGRLSVEPYLFVMGLLNLIIEGRIDDAKDKYLNISDDEWIKLINLSENLAKNHKYFDWVSKMWSMRDQYPTLPELPIDEYVNRVEILVKSLEKYKKYLEKTDVYQYSSLWELGSDLEKVHRDSSRNIKDYPESETLYEDDEVKLVRPLSHKASCYYGTGTKWCTTTKDDERQWKDYSRQGVLFYLLHKSLPTSHDWYKIAIHLRWNDSMALYNAKDKILGNDWVDHLNDRPQLMDIMKKSVESSISQMPELLFNWEAFGSPVFTLDGHVKEFRLTAYKPKRYGSHEEFRKDYPEESTYITQNVFDTKGDLIVFVRKDLTEQP